MPILIPVPRYQPLNPYHSYYDNLPIEAIDMQLFIINSQVENNQYQIESAIGNTGSLSNRLNKSLNDDGTIKPAAIDDALHNIADHSDGDGYVRMTDTERDKLSLIDSGATNLSIDVETISTTLTWPDVSTTISLSNSDTIAWRFSSGKVFADTTFAKSLITTKHYNITPVTSDDINFTTSGSNTPYKANTLRVYVNGLRLTKSPNTIGGFYYTETDSANGEFALNSALQPADIIRIDFDQPLS